MISVIYNFLEILSIVVCFGYLYNKKFKLDIATISVILADVILLKATSVLQLPNEYTFLVYPILLIYCAVEYGFKIRALIVNSLLCIIIIATLQFLASLFYVFALRPELLGPFQFAVINSITLLATYFVLKWIKIYRLSMYLQNKGWLLSLSLIFCFFGIFFCINFFKNSTQYNVNIISIVLVCILLVCLLAANLGKYRIKAIEAEAELKVRNVYEASYQKLIENIRLRQHEFDNHINTIYSQHYIYKTYDELVQVQEKYCRELEQDNQLNKLLSAGNSIMIGFLYGKFLEIQKRNIEVDYKVNIKELECKVPVYKLIEVLSDLINNAAEALQSAEGCNKLFVFLLELDDKIQMEVRNQNPVIEYEELQKFFAKGYSKKGEGRGLGLYNVKKISEEYGMDICCNNVSVDNHNWISFQITIKK